MSVSASTQIQKTSDPAVFQRQCKVLFECVLKDPHIEEFGTSGQGQSGIDLLGRRRDRGLDHWVGVQCKLTIKSQRLKTGRNGVVEVEAARALAFDPTLRELIIATTANNDASLQKEAANFTDRQAKLGRDFTVQVWGWETLSTHIAQSEKALKAFMPDAFPQINRMVRGQERITEELSEISRSQSSILFNQGAALEFLEKICINTMSGAPIQGAWDDRSVDTLIDRQVDRFRDMINAGRPRTALELLEGLWENLADGVERRLRFRIRANIAACHLRIGDEKKAAEIYLEAYEYAPSDPKAKALKVLAYILLGRPSDALAFGRIVLTNDCDQGSLIANMISASKFVSDEESALDLITPAVADDPAVLLAKIDYLRSRQDTEVWWRFAKESHLRHPGDENLASASAEADIDRAAHWTNANDRRPLDLDLREQVFDATKTLQVIIDRFHISESSWSDYNTSLCINISIGYRLLGMYEKAKNEIVKSLDKIPGDIALLKALLSICLESGDHSKARRALEELPECRDVIIGRLEVAANAGDWHSIIEIRVDDNLDEFESDDLALIESLKLLSKSKIYGVKDIRGQADDILNKYSMSAIVPVIFYDIAIESRDRIWASELFRVAFERRDQANSATKIMLAAIAEREDDMEKAIELLDGRVDLNNDSEQLRILARAFVNAPVRQSSIAFAQALSLRLESYLFYLRVIAGIYYNCGDLANSETYFQKAVNLDRNDVAAHIGLINTWLRRDRHENVGAHLDGIDLGTLNGSPAHKLELAQILVAFERTVRGLSYGYDVALKNRGDRRVVMLYIGLILPDPTGARIPATGAVVGIDCWVKVERADGHILTFVIEARPTREDPSHFGSDHAFSKLFLGQRVNATVVSVPRIGTEERWRVVEIRHKYIALLREFIDNFPARFPDAAGIYRFEANGGDFEGFLNEIKRLGEQDERIVRNYADGQIPLALAAGLHGKSAVEFAGRLVSRGEGIRTCMGNNEERSSAVQAVLAARSKGVVLDTYTAWIAQQLGLLDVLKSLFGRVALPRSSVDELGDWRRRLEPDGDEPLLTVGYLDGQHFREEIPAERLRESAARIGEGISAICRELEILPAIAPGAPSEVEERITSICKYGVFDPIYISYSEDLLVLSDDLLYRSLALELHGREGAWLQAALMVACMTEVIGIGRYADAVFGLAVRRHSHVSLTSLILLEIFEHDLTNELEKLQIVLGVIGNIDAEVSSHVNVSSSFLDHIWRNGVPKARGLRATNMILFRLYLMLRRDGAAETAFRAMISTRFGSWSLRQHAVSWAKGHFLSI